VIKINRTASRIFFFFLAVIVITGMVLALFPGLGR
jgi:hypothetical protein